MPTLKQVADFLDVDEKTVVTFAYRMTYEGYDEVTINQVMDWYEIDGFLPNWVESFSP